MKIVFMGTPEFAVPSLEILYQAGYEIVGVITAPDRMGGRGRKTVIESAVKQAAKQKGLKILQPKNLKSTEFQSELRSLQADLQIVVAFRMLPVAVWDMPPLGTYNLHGSLLPKYRGAAPINWAIIEGETTTGVTSFKLKHEIDTGSILLQREIPIYADDNASMLHDRMKPIAAETVLESVKLIETGNYSLKEQDNKMVSHAPKLNRENTQIDFNQSSKKVYDFIRGLSLYPGAWFFLGNEAVKVYKCRQIEDLNKESPGTIKSDNKNYIRIVCKSGAIEVLDLKYPGKRRMEVSEFLNGYDIND